MHDDLSLPLDVAARLTGAIHRRSEACDIGTQLESDVPSRRRSESVGACVRRSFSAAGRRKC
eukprot:3798331-Rhodomonas_salina.1